MTYRAGIYCRISRDRIGAGLGIERQEQDCRELADRLGWVVVDTYADNDLSAYSGKRRPHYERLLGDIEAGYLTAVITWHADRLHRSPVELERYIAVCDGRSVPTQTVRAGHLDLSTANGRMNARITGAVARHESEQKGERVRRQKQQAQAQGRWIGGRRPFGFAPDGVTLRPTVEQLQAMCDRAAALYGDTVPTVDRLGQLADRVTAEADAIADATRRILAGESVRSVVSEWNRAGLTTATGTQWDGSKARQMLLRPRNAGLAGNRSRTIGPAVWDPIVDRDSWEALVALLGDPSRRTHWGTSLKLVGSFLYRCDCGERVRSGGQRGDGKARYACTANHMRRLAEPVDQLVFEVVERVLVRDNLELIAPAADLAPLRDRLTTLRARSDEIAAMFGDPDSDMTSTQFRVANERLQHEIRATEAELGRRSVGTTLTGIADASDPAFAFRSAGIDRQRAVIDTLMTVTLMRTKRGRRPGGHYFDPSSVKIEWKAGA
ncbi:MAG: recombinase family protein [Pseudonocardiaceae bacterium]